MKYNKYILALTAFVFAMTCPLSLGAQINFTSSVLKVNGLSTFGRKALQINDFGGTYWTYDNASKFFQLDITGASPRIAGTDDLIMFYNPDTRCYNSIEAATVYNLSDARAKTDVQCVNGALETLSRLRPVTFNWKKPTTETLTKEAVANHADEQLPTSSEQAMQYGFLAQEVEEVIPEIVKTNDTGEKLINYTAIIPMLVQSIQDLQSLLEQQNDLIDGLKERLDNNQPYMNMNRSKLVGCTPNPTSGYVSIATELEAGVSEATVIITSMSGNREKVMTVSASEQTATADVSSLPAGIHIVSLYVDGRLADSTRLIKQ